MIKYLLRAALVVSVCARQSIFKPKRYAISPADDKNYVLGFSESGTIKLTNAAEYKRKEHYGFEMISGRAKNSIRLFLYGTALCLENEDTLKACNSGDKIPDLLIIDLVEGNHYKIVLASKHTDFHKLCLTHSAEKDVYFKRCSRSSHHDLWDISVYKKERHIHIIDSEDTQNFHYKGRYSNAGIIEETVYYENDKAKARW